MNRPLTRRSVVAKTVFAVTALAALSFAPRAWSKTHLRIATTAAAMDQFENWTSVGSWETINAFDNRNASRPVVELVLELQALKAGGLDFDVELVRTLTYELAKTEVVEGRAELMAETVWDDEIAATGEKLLKTDAVIRDGEFAKGVYALPKSEVLGVTSADGLRAFKAAVVGTWALDVKTIGALNVKAVVTEPTPEMVFMALRRHDADFTLEEFSSRPDLRVERGGVSLVPVPGYKVAILGSRSWVVNAASPAARQILQALSKGEKLLHDNGTIERAFSESGFFNQKVSNWKRLN
jgi:hypothetical protein